MNVPWLYLILLEAMSTDTVSPSGSFFGVPMILGLVAESGTMVLEEFSPENQQILLGQLPKW